MRKYSTTSATGTITPEPPFPSYPNKILDNDFHQNLKQPPSNYPPPILSQPTYNSNSSSQPFCNNPSSGTPQIGNNIYNQTNMHTRTVPPTPPPDSSSRCMTPSGIKPGITF